MAARTNMNSGSAGANVSNAEWSFNTETHKVSFHHVQPCLQHLGKVIHGKSYNSFSRAPSRVTPVLSHLFSLHVGTQINSIDLFMNCAR